MRIRLSTRIMLSVVIAQAIMLVLLVANSVRLINTSHAEIMEQYITETSQLLSLSLQPGLIAHSDRGSQYCSGSFKELLEKNGYCLSMSSTGNCYDNAITESFFGTLKTELIPRSRISDNH